MSFSVSAVETERGKLWPCGIGESHRLSRQRAKQRRAMCRNSASSSQSVQGESSGREANLLRCGHDDDLPWQSSSSGTRTARVIEL